MKPYAKLSAIRSCLTFREVHSWETPINCFKTLSLPPKINKHNLGLGLKNKKKKRRNTFH